MGAINPVASSRATKHKVFERTETCQAPSDIGAKPTPRRPNDGLAKSARARRHYPPSGREAAAEITATIDPPGFLGRAGRPVQGHAEPFHDTDSASELLVRGRKAAIAVGEILLLAASLGTLLAAAVTLAAGLAYLFII
jgi:hypothetical protein